MRDLVAVPKEAVTVLDEHLLTVVPVKQAILQMLIKDLDSDRFEVRDRALRRLQALGEVAQPALLQALANNPSHEARRRIKELLDTLHALPVGDSLAVIRAVEILESIDSPEARHVLQRLAEGAPAATVTRQAKAALGRLGPE
jgi:HEAT repeat protein